MPRVSIINCVSRAYEMLRFSSEQLIENAGTDNFDYIIVCWHTTKEVDDYISSLFDKFCEKYPRLKVHRINHREVPNVGYVHYFVGKYKEISRSFKELPTCREMTLVLEVIK